LSLELPAAGTASTAWVAPETIPGRKEAKRYAKKKKKKKREVRNCNQNPHGKE
jgi:hypothetical protein